MDSTSNEDDHTRPDNKQEIEKRDTKKKMSKEVNRHREKRGDTAKYTRQKEQTTKRICRIDRVSERQS